MGSFLRNLAVLAAVTAAGGFALMKAAGPAVSPDLSLPPLVVAHDAIPSSMIYAYAAIKEGIPYANAAPNLTAGASGRAIEVIVDGTAGPKSVTGLTMTTHGSPRPAGSLEYVNTFRSPA